ncbi:MAG: hypothetical protein ACTJHT_06355 [Sphingobacterium sp.]|uniref:hypothetical protein n=1 Tax=Sphingobacterium sp. JB170 TaxID=1434842 RepID=UPI0011799606|nr:hypothetical protein [Sphingobacterium sp. JB170]
MKKIIHSLFFTIVSIVFCQAQPQRIDEFIVKENLTQNGKLAIIALDSMARPQEYINGTFAFSLNGFQQQLNFHDGIAVIQQPLESSTFVFFKHENQEKSIGQLYFVHKSDSELKPFKIHGLLLLIIPTLILLIAYFFKRFIATLLILGLIYAYVHYAKGLDFSQIIESIFHSLHSFI